MNNDTSESPLLRYLKSTRFLTNGIIAWAVILALLGGVFIQYVLKRPLPDLYLDGVIFGVAVLGVFASLVIIIRKEMPLRHGLASIRGWLAQVAGVLGLLIWGGVAYYGLTQILSALP